MSKKTFNCEILASEASKLEKFVEILEAEKANLTKVAMAQQTLLSKSFIDHSDVVWKTGESQNVYSFSDFKKVYGQTIKRLEEKDRIIKNSANKAKRLRDISGSVQLSNEYMEIFGDALYLKAQ